MKNIAALVMAAAVTSVATTKATFEHLSVKNAAVSHGVWVGETEDFVAVYQDEAHSSPTIAIRHQESSRPGSPHNFAISMRSGRPVMQVYADGETKIVDLMKLAELAE